MPVACGQIGTRVKFLIRRLLMKRQNTLKIGKTHIGLNYGEHVIRADSMTKDLDTLLTRCANSFVVRCRPEVILPDEVYIEIAKFAKERNMSFLILYAYQHPPKGMRSHLKGETVKAMYDVAGELFLGEIFAETGSQSCSMDSEYYVEMENENLVKPPQDFPDMHAARKRYVDYISQMMEYEKEIGIKNTVMVEPTAISAYALEGGIDVPVLEMLPGDPEKLLAFTRGASIGYEKETFGGFIAHEWYGGYRHDDELKRKRLGLAYKYLYMSGASYIFLESGNTEINSFGDVRDYGDEACKFYRDSAKEHFEFFNNTPRLPYGPYAKVAFVFGEDDGYADFLGGSTWCQFGREEWGKGDRERSWRILSEVYRSTPWHEQENFAADGLDLSGAPAYGTYDVIPAASPLHVMKGYDYLIFVGHNTMSEELYTKLCDYVRGGGVLFAGVAHLATDSRRSGEHEYVRGGDFTDLFGVKLVGKTRENHGVKFYRDSIVENVKYPGTNNLECDANYPSGYADIARLELSGARAAAILADTFLPPEGETIPVLTENKVGEGSAILLSYLAYPGAPEVYPLYKIIVKALLRASHASADIKVAGSDKVRFSVFFDGEGKRQMWLLNTAFTGEDTVTVYYGGKSEVIRLSSGEVRVIEL